MLEGGTSISWRRPWWSSWYLQLAVVEGAAVPGVVSGTLLGPEGPGPVASCLWVGVAGVWLLWLVGPAELPGCPGGGVGCRLYVENFTVDASIFVAKFLRAHGGCLGTRNRRRT